VDILIEGSVQQSGEDVLFTLQLIDGRTDRHLWSDSYKRPLQDVLTLQGEVAYAIAQAVQVTLTPREEARLVRKRSTDSNAIRMWIVGNHHLKVLGEESANKALRAFEEATLRDPDFADAYAGIAHAYASLGGWHSAEVVDKVLPLARAAAEKAIELDPDLANAHFALGRVHWHMWEWEAAEREFKKGRELNPSDMWGLDGYANFLSSIGRFNDAIAVARQAVDIDPLSPVARNELGSVLWLMGQEDAALRQYQDALQLDPNFIQTQWILADYYIWAHEYDKALPFIEKLGAGADTLAPTTIGQLGGFYAIVGRGDDALDILSHLLQRTETEYIQGSALAYVYVGLKDYDAALTWLEVAYEQRDMTLVWLQHDPYFVALHGDPRFQDLLNRMNFPVRK
jgi:Tfp pilus assembly protein PilF